MTDTTIDIPVPGITWDKITDQICTALEGGSNYWLQCFEPQSSRENVTEIPWYSDTKFWSGVFEIKAQVWDDEKTYTFNRESVINGLNWLSAHYLSRVVEIVEETGDAETADVFMQACLLGEIVYG
jgi:hypothetical protein